MKGGCDEKRKQEKNITNKTKQISGCIESGSLYASGEPIDDEALLCNSLNFLF